MEEKSPLLSWFSLSRKYWFEQIIFYLLATFSFLGSYLIKKSSLDFAFELVKKGRAKDIEYKISLAPQWILFNFGSAMRQFLLVMSLIVLVYCVLVFAHVYFAFWFNNQILYDLKKKILKKNFRLQGPINEKKNLSSLIQDSSVFAEWVVYAPNQIYYILLETIAAFWLVWGSPSGVFWWAFAYFFFTLAACVFFQFLLQKKNLILQRQLEKQTIQETELIKNRDLLIKKNWEKTYSQEYQRILRETQKKTNQKDLFYVASFVIPSYSLIKYSKYFFFPFVSSSQDFIAFNIFVELLEATKKMLERLRNYPYYFSAKKRLNYFFSQVERQVQTNQLLFQEPVEVLASQDLAFAYQSGQTLLANLNFRFEKGKVNYLKGANGTGKSTIINLIMGLYRPQKGAITVNQQHKLSELNLPAWRDKIAYAEHNNLVKLPLSTGQKQWIDLEQTLAQTNKEIFIFDEADNSLDRAKKEEFTQKLQGLSKNKLVILISH